MAVADNLALNLGARRCEPGQAVRGRRHGYWGPVGRIAPELMVTGPPSTISGMGCYSNTKRNFAALPDD